MGMQEVMQQSWLRGGTQVHRYTGAQVPGTSLAFQQGGAMFALGLEIRVMWRQEVRARLNKSRAASEWLKGR